MIRYLYTIEGFVQGVGFRPFIYKIAIKYNLTGFVLNDSNGVIVEVEGIESNIKLFEEYLSIDLPPLAKITHLQKCSIPPINSVKFEIIKTKVTQTKTTLVSPDVKVCDDCLEDIKIEGKYKNYFSINCTNCGPRYSIIKTVPYDRVSTSMSKFPFCESCQSEYENPYNRRYHAQAISCKNCGPQLHLVDNKNTIIKTQNIYTTIASYIKNGKIIAIKGIGGFHIVCNANDDGIIQKLRLSKNRPTKPFAIMCKDIHSIKHLAILSTEEEKILSSKEAPIVIVKKKDVCSLNISDFVAPNINRVGCFLPYTPFLHLLFQKLESSIIATSANLSGEPIIIEKKDILKKLPFVDYIVDFNRDIENALDDSLVQVVNNDIQTLRNARGYTPKVIKLPKTYSKKVLAIGANQKNTISILLEDNLIISPHIGDLDSIKAFEYFERTIETFKKFYDFEPEIIVCDKHPNYETTKWAKKQTIPIIQVQHHLSHIYACKAEFLLEKEYLGFSFDGTGYGDDGTLWEEKY